MKAHSLEQYEKWKDWADGDITEPSEMYILVYPYLDEMYKMFGTERMDTKSREEEIAVLDEFSNAIELPKDCLIKEQG